ncbi:MAG: hypothetical protein AAFR28_14195 [Pseudomonadota bacterium]
MTDPQDRIAYGMAAVLRDGDGRCLLANLIARSGFLDAAPAPGESHEHFAGRRAIGAALVGLMDALDDDHWPDLIKEMRGYERERQRQRQRSADDGTDEAGDLERRLSGR